MDIKDSYLHGTVGVIKSISVSADKLTYNLADVNNTAKTITLPLATTTANGLMSKDDKVAINSLGNYVTLNTDLDITGIKTFTKQLKFTVAKGTAPFLVTSDTKVDNLNADLLDGKHLDDVQKLGLRFSTITKNDGNYRNPDLLEGGMITNYNDPADWKNAPINMLYGSIFAMMPHYTNQLSGLFAWDTTNSLWFRMTNGTTWKPWRTVVFTDSNITGNAASADKLKTKRKLWGLDFDGTADVSGNMTGVGSIGMNGDIVINDGVNHDRYIKWLYNNTDEYGWRIGYLGSKSGDDNDLTFDSYRNKAGWASALYFKHATLNAHFAGIVNAPTFKGNLDGTYVNKLTNYSKATAIGSIATTDSLNTALGKLEFKTDFIYNDLFGTDNDDVINKWHEVVDFIDNVKEGTDITDEFVTRKTALTITGTKTFASNTFILEGVERSNIKHATQKAYNWGGYGGANNTPNYTGMYNSLDFHWYDYVWSIGNLRGGGSFTNGFGIGLKKRNDNGDLYFAPAFRITETASYINNNKIWHAGNDGSGSGLDADLLDGNHASAFAMIGHTHNYASIGSVAFTPANTELTPSLVLTLTGGWSIKKGTWDYAGNGYIVAGSFGNIDLAGTSVLTFGNSNAYTQLYITAPAQSGHSGKTNEIFFYNNHGSNYSPGWTRIITNRNYTDYVNTTNFPGLNKIGTVTSVTVTGANGLSGSGTVTTSGTITLSNAGVRSTTINGDYLRVNTNGTNSDLTIPYATTANLLNNTSVSDPNTAASGLNVKWYSQISASSGYAGTNYGFPISNNANGILWLGTHSGPYGWQMGFSSNGRIYARYISNNTFPTTANGGSWNTIAWVSDIVKNIVVNQHTSSNVEYPLVWSNLNNTNTVTENLLYKSYSHLTYNPAELSITVNRYKGNYTNLILTSMRHIDAGLNAVSTDHLLFIGYGAQTWTDMIRFYYSTGTSGTNTITGRTEFFRINSSGSYALTRLGVNGLNTSYTFYAYGLQHMIKNNGCVNLYLKADTDVVDLYSIIRFGINGNDNASYIFQNGPKRTNDGGANTMTIRNQVGILRLQNRVHIDSTGRIYPEASSSRRTGMYGVYDSTKIGHIWSIGTSYMIPDDGSTFGNLYGLAYKHTNNSTGGTMAGGHLVVWCEAGNPKVSLGYNGVWVSGGFYKNGSSDSYVLLGGGGHKSISSIINGGYIGTTLVLTSSKAQALSGISSINERLTINAESDLTRLGFGGVHNVVFGEPGYAHRGYYFRPSYSASGNTLTEVFIQNASAANFPTWTTTHAFFSNGNATHTGSVTAGLFYANNASGPHFTGVSTSGNWAYLRLNNSTCYWDIATKNNSGSGGLWLARYNGGDNGIFVSTRSNIGIGNSAPADKLDVTGNIRATRESKYMLLRLESDLLSSFYTNATQYYFDKSIYVNGAIWRYNTNYGIDSDGYFYTKGVYANRDGSNTLGGVSLYSNSDPMMYGIAFRSTGIYGTHGYVTAANDWATYLTMNESGTTRGWIFRRGSTNVFSIAGSGDSYANGLINASKFISRVATGTQPYACTSTTVNTNLNADLLDGLHASDFVRAYGTYGTSYSIDSDWGQSIVTFDPVCGGTYPMSTPNATLLNMGNSYTRRKQLFFDYNTNNIYYRRRVNSYWNPWVRIALVSDIPSSLPANGGNADTVDNKHASDFATAKHTHNLGNKPASDLSSTYPGGISVGGIYNNGYPFTYGCTITASGNGGYFQIAGQWNDGVTGSSNNDFPTEMYIRGRRDSFDVWTTWSRVLTNRNYTSCVNTTNFPGLNKTGTVTSITVTGSNGLGGSGTITTSGTITLSNVGVRSTTINGNYLRVNTNGTNADLTIPYSSNAESAYTLNKRMLPTTASNTANTVWCKFATITFNESSYKPVSGYLFFNDRESPGYSGILLYHFRAGLNPEVLGTANLNWLVTSNSSIQVIAVKTANNIYDLYMNNISAWVTPVIHHLSTEGSFVWNVGSWTTTKPTAAFASSARGIVNYASSASVASTVTVTNSDANSTYKMVWHSNNTLYSTAGIYCNPSTDCIYATHFYESSDILLKENISSILGTDNIPILRKFNWKKDGKVGYGFIALELEELGYYELVSGSEDGTKTVHYTAALSLVVAKLQNKIKELEKEIEMLKYKN